MVLANRFATLSLRSALQGTTVLVAFFMCGLLAFGGFALMETNNNFDHLLEGPLAMQGITRHIAAQLDDARLHESAFLARRDEKEVGLWEKSLGEIGQELEKLHGLDARHGHTDDLERNQKVRELLENYRASFLAAVAAWKSKGLTEESGLQANFQNAAKELASIMAEFDSSEMRIHLNAVRRWEKAYILGGAQDAILGWREDLKNFQTALQTSSMSHFDKDKIQGALAGYGKQLEAYVETRRQGAVPDAQETALTLDRQLAAAEENLARHYVPNLMQNLLTARRHEKDYLISPNARYVKRFKKSVEEIWNGLQKARLISQGTRDTLLALLSKYQENFLLLVAKDEEIAQSLAVMNQAVTNIDTLLIDIVHDTELETGEKRTHIQDQNRQRMRAALGVGVAALLLVGLIHFLIARLVLRQVGGEPRHLAADAAQVASGDLTVRIPGNTGIAAAMGEMLSGLLSVARGAALHSESIVAAVEQLRQAERGLDQDTRHFEERMTVVLDGHDQVDGAIAVLREELARVEENSDLTRTVAEGLTARLASLSASAREASGHLQGVAASSGESSQTLRQVRGVAENTGGNVQQVAASIEEVTQALAQVREHCRETHREGEDARKNAADTRRVMERLEEAAGRIGQAVEMIKKIADQTNLLALNAAIEAASAGEAGRGFAVVAVEVKELARQTKEATEMIRQQVEGIQGSSREASLATEGVMARIEHLGLLNGEILDQVTDQSSHLDQVSRSTALVAAEMESVVRQVSQVTEQIGAVDGKVQEITGAVGEITRLVAMGAEGAREATRRAADTRQRVSRMGEYASDMFAAAARAQSETLKAMDLASHARGAVGHMGRLVEVVSGVAEEIRHTQERFQVGAVPFDIKAVKSLHLAWLGQVDQSLRGRLDAGEIPGADACPFGQWRETTAESNLEDDELFREAQQTHALLHDLLQAGSRPTEGEIDAERIEGWLADHETARVRFFQQLDALYLEGR